MLFLDLSHFNRVVPAEALCKRGVSLLSQSLFFTWILPVKGNSVLSLSYFSFSSMFIVFKERTELTCSFIYIHIYQAAVVACYTVM